ncbi:branched-chain amino acid ABC transporter permease [Dehalobacter sp. DCM]|uniref:branched-chain amino acid ABC transporter permease n=1 Tax=Dehalobacter sp. DCM TaxID=2907827 RepID=UPI003081B7FB|nr:branched-chain amino acid ABC transporter permease [Dehalobacter sp. DCM]
MGEQLLQLLFSGLTLGGIYSVIALVLVITYKITGILNLALGEFLVLGALLTVTFKTMGMPLIAASLLAMLAVALIAGALERLTVNKVRGASGLTMLIITIGIAIALRGLALLIWGTDTYSLPAFTSSKSIIAGGAALNPQSIWVLLLAGITLIGVNLFFGRTYWGKAVTASVLSPTGARLQGINLSTISLAAFIFSGALATAAGICIGPVTMITYDMGFMLGVKGFIAATIGGLGSVSGAVIGGLILGLLEAYSSGLISSGLNDAISIIILLAVLMIRPEGILGAIRTRRV